MVLDIYGSVKLVNYNLKLTLCQQSKLSQSDFNAVILTVSRIAVNVGNRKALFRILHKWLPLMKCRSFAIYLLSNSLSDSVNY